MDPRFQQEINDIDKALMTLNNFILGDGKHYLLTGSQGTRKIVVEDHLQPALGKIDGDAKKTVSSPMHDAKNGLNRSWKNLIFKIARLQSEYDKLNTNLENEDTKRKRTDPRLSSAYIVNFS